MAAPVKAGRPLLFCAIAIAALDKPLVIAFWALTLSPGMSFTTGPIILLSSTPARSIANDLAALSKALPTSPPLVAVLMSTLPIAVATMGDIATPRPLLIALPKANAGLAASIVNVGADKTTDDAVTAPLVANSSAPFIRAISAALAVAKLLVATVVAAASPTAAAVAALAPVAVEAAVVAAPVASASVPPAAMTSVAAAAASVMPGKVIISAVVSAPSAAPRVPAAPASAPRLAPLVATAAIIIAAVSRGLSIAAPATSPKAVATPPITSFKNPPPLASGTKVLTKVPEVSYLV